jgi:hypothetical protein
MAGAPVSNPVSFSSAALLRSLGLCDSGRNHVDVSDWLDLMSSTTIISEGAVYLAGSRRWARDRFRVFDRAVSRGRQLEDGSIAERNYVWFSDWQLENINSRHLLPIDLDVYRQLKTHIARALVLHLQIWLYASQRARLFEKRYVDVCQLLGLRAYDHHSKIVEKLGPALDELAAHQYVSSWAIARTSDDRAFKLVLQHGALFTGAPTWANRQIGSGSVPNSATTRPALQAPALAEAPPPPEVDETLLNELTNRGVTPRRARHLLTAKRPSQDVMRQLEWGDFVMSRVAPGTFWNPAGFYVALLRDNLEPPAHFRSSRQQAESDEARQALLDDRTHTTQLREYYSRYRDEQAAAYLATMDAAERERTLELKSQELRSRFSTLQWTAERLRSVAEVSLRAELAAELPIIDFRAFVQQISADLARAADVEEAR